MRMCRCVLSVSEMAIFFNQPVNLTFYGITVENVPEVLSHLGQIAMCRQKGVAFERSWSENGDRIDFDFFVLK